MWTSSPARLQAREVMLLAHTVMVAQGVLNDKAIALYDTAVRNFATFDFVWSEEAS